MIKVFETFSGIGSQAKALEKQGISHTVVNTVDWDINAIYAYDIIHNGPQNLEFLEGYSKDELFDILVRYTLSADGKKPMSNDSIRRLPLETMKRVYAAIIRTKNLVNIQDVTAEHLPVDLDLLTYSFPCQDLSISGFWHGNKGGIERNSNNRSSMLWEIERILFDIRDSDKPLPKFLLMENVTAIKSPRHIDHFNEWQSILTEMGYYNQVYDLNANDFGVPQRRKRTFMLSVFVGPGETRNRSIVQEFFKDNNLETQSKLNPKVSDVSEFLRMDYSDKTILAEVLSSIPNHTKSRERIHIDNPLIYNLKEKSLIESVRTITTKQDRHPNSGVIEHSLLDNKSLKLKGKSPFRYLTPRECFLLMGFEEKDYVSLSENNFKARKNGKFLTRDKLNKMAGNSIVVDVLESIFVQLVEIKKVLEL